MQTLSAPTRILLLTGILACGGLTAQSQLMSLKAATPMAACSTGDVWAIGERYMLLARRSQGFTVVDAADPANPVTATIRPPGYPRGSRSFGVGDIKADGQFIYATDESTNQGVFFYDARTNPMNPTYLGSLAHTRARSVHDCWIEGNTLYCVSNNTRLIEVYDISNKTAPVWLS